MALRQETTPLYLSEFAAKALAFQQVTLARRIEDGAWEIAQNGPLRTVRVDDAWGWPDLDNQPGSGLARCAARALRFISPRVRWCSCRAKRLLSVPTRTCKTGRFLIGLARRGARLRIRGHVHYHYVGGVRSGRELRSPDMGRGANTATNTARGVLSSVRDARHPRYPCCSR